MALGIICGRDLQLYGGSFILAAMSIVSHVNTMYATTTDTDTMMQEDRETRSSV